MADTVKLRRILNQACMNKTDCCTVIDCFEEPVSCCGYSGKIKRNNWWVREGRVPCFCCSYNYNQVAIHPQDPIK